jgi:hypothetical protein
MSCFSLWWYPTATSLHTGLDKGFHFNWLVWFPPNNCTSSKIIARTQFHDSLYVQLPDASIRFNAEISPHCKRALIWFWSAISKFNRACICLYQRKLHTLLHLLLHGLNSVESYHSKHPAIRKNLNLEWLPATSI